jgi:hypothetical protein
VEDVGGWLAVSLAGPFKLRNDLRRLTLEEIGYPAAAAFGFMPLLIYGAWLGNQIDSR